MAEFRKIPVAALVEPLNAMRSVSILEGMDELMASMQSNGLIHPINVRDVGDGTFRIIAGHRRSIAATKLGWELIDAKVLSPDEADDDILMAEENLHRTQTNPMEEAVMYRRLIQDKGMQPEGIAATYHQPLSRINNLLSLLEGDERVAQLVGQGKVSVAQAIEINQFKSETYKLLAMEQATKNKMSSENLRRWRKSLELDGRELNVDDALNAASGPVTIDMSEPTWVCEWGNHVAVVAKSRKVIMCNDCHNLNVQGLESLQREAALKERGLWQEYLKLVNG